MSHFTVLVIGEDVEKQLQPYHEYECTGIKDEYVIDVNKNDVVKEFLGREVYYGTKNDGSMDYHYNSVSCVEHGLTDVKFGTRLEYFLDKGLSSEEIDEEISEYNGFTKVGDNWMSRTNPNAKWNWWVIGGRWTGFFKLKEGAEGELGRPGIFTTPAEDGYVDSILKRDLDIDSMRMKKEEIASKRYDLVFEGTKDTEEPETWEHIRDVKFPSEIDEARKYYHNQERIVAFKKVCGENDDLFGYYSESYEEFNVSREEYIRRERNGAISTYALVKDSVWYSKGNMGWFGMSSDDVNEDEWNDKFNKFIDECPDDTRFTLVDCHI